MHRISARTVMHKPGGVGTCLYCAQLIRSGDELLDHLRDKHKPEGYAVMVEAQPGGSSNAWKGYIRYRVKIAGPCGCGCGKMMIYPKGRYIPATAPPFYASGHRTPEGGNAGSFKPGIVPANKGIKRPGWTNQGSFRKGHLPANYKGGIASSGGVVSRLVPGQKYPCGATVRVNVGREVGALIVGRPLRKSEVIYHKDGDYRNNDPGNIEVLERSVIINRTRAKLLAGRSTMSNEKIEERSAAEEARAAKRLEKLNAKEARRKERIETREAKQQARIEARRAKQVRKIAKRRNVQSEPEPTQAIHFEPITKSAKGGLSLDHLRRDDTIQPKKEKRVKYVAPLPNAPRELWGTFCEKCRGLIMPNQPHYCK